MRFSSSSALLSAAILNSASWNICAVPYSSIVVALLLVPSTMPLARSITISWARIRFSFSTVNSSARRFFEMPSACVEVVCSHDAADDEDPPSLLCNDLVSATPNPRSIVTSTVPSGLPDALASCRSVCACMKVCASAEDWPSANAVDDIVCCCCCCSFGCCSSFCVSF